MGWYSYINKFFRKGNTDNYSYSTFLIPIVI